MQTGCNRSHFDDWRVYTDSSFYNGAMTTPTYSTSGSRVVLAMFGMGLIFAVSLWLYQSISSAPFRPLIEALSKEFPDSQIRVEGGAYKSHLDDSETRLRILMRTTLNLHDDPVVLQRVNSVASRVKALKFNDYQILEIYLYRKDAATDQNFRSIRRPMSDFPLDTIQPTTPKSSELESSKN